MAASQTSHPAITVARYVVGVGSAVELGWSMWIVIVYLRTYFEATVLSYWNFLDVAFYMSSPIGFLLLAHFCLFRWQTVEHQEGIGACYTISATVPIIGTVGTLAYNAAFPHMFSHNWQLVVPVLGFWMLWGFLLASGIRKLRRTRQDANAE